MHSIERSGLARPGSYLDVLIADENAGNAELVAKALRSRYPELNVEIAMRVDEVMAKLSNDDNPALVLASPSMSGLDGRQLGKALKKAYGRRVEVVIFPAPPMKNASITNTEHLARNFDDITKIYAIIDKWHSSKDNKDVIEDPIRFKSKAKATRGKHGILIPREKILKGDVDPDAEYDIYLKKAKKH